MAGWETMSENKEDETKKAEFAPEEFPLEKSDTEKVVLDIASSELVVSAEELLARVRERLLRMEMDFAHLGSDLFQIRQLHSYKAILDEKGKPRYADFESYWAGEFGQPIKNAHKLIDMYKKYVKECGIDLDTLKAVGVTKAQTMLSVINKTNARELVEKATVLRVPEFRKEIAKLRPRPHRLIEASKSATFNPTTPPEVRPEMVGKVETSYNTYNHLDVIDPADANTLRAVQFYLFPQHVPRWARTYDDSPGLRSQETVNGEEVGSKATNASLQLREDLWR
jgi:hypothetical protein